MNFLERAQFYLQNDVPIIPVVCPGKAPLSMNGANSGTTNSTQIDRWAAHYPDANVGVVARYDSWWFLDDDAGTLHNLIELPDTLTVSTSRGFHYYFKHDDLSRATKYGRNDNSGVINVPGFKGEARVNNQYVVGINGIHLSGHVYAITNDAPVAVAPANLIEWLQKVYAESEDASGRRVYTKPTTKWDPLVPHLICTRPTTSEADRESFQNLAERVGWEPLINRMNKMEDERFHGADFRPARMNFCPFPSHVKPDDNPNAPWSPCFGAMRKTPDVLHCIVCGWTGDVISAIQKLDELPTAYDAARVVCAEMGIDFEEYFEVAATEVARPCLSDEEIEKDLGF